MGLNRMEFSQQQSGVLWRCFVSLSQKVRMNLRKDAFSLFKNVSSVIGASGFQLLVKGKQDKLPTTRISLRNIISCC